MFYNDFGDFMTKKTDIKDKIINAINDLRPYLNMDGGDIEFVKYDEEDRIVYVRLTGACQACLFTDDTLKNGVYETLKRDIPEIEGVVNVTL